MYWLLLILLSGCGPGAEQPSQAAALEARLNALETEVGVLRSEVRRLHGEKRAVDARLDRMRSMDLKEEADRLPDDVALKTPARSALTWRDYPPNTPPELMELAPRSRREAMKNLHSLRTAEKAYHAEWDVFTSTPRFPMALPGQTPQPFNRDNAPREWSLLGWLPDHDVLCQYEVKAENAGRAMSDAFVARARCDADADGDVAEYSSNRGRGSTMITAESTY